MQDQSPLQPRKLSFRLEKELIHEEFPKLGKIDEGKLHEATEGLDDTLKIWIALHETLPQALEVWNIASSDRVV